MFPLAAFHSSGVSRCVVGALLPVVFSTDLWWFCPKLFAYSLLRLTRPYGLFQGDFSHDAVNHMWKHSE